jgi:signal transduction histidine kinase
VTGTLGRLVPRSLTGQITGIVAISVTLGIILTLAMVVLVFRMTLPGRTPSSVAIHILDLTRLVRATATPADADLVIAIARRAGFNVSKVAISDLVSSQDGAAQRMSAAFIERKLNSEPGIEVLDGLRYPPGPQDQIAVRLDDRHALVFEATAGLGLWRFVLTPTALALTTVLVFALLLSIYAIRWITAPLAAVAEAARSFGRSAESEQAVRRHGPREIRQVAAAINEMRTRIRALLDDRSRMLAAISHDLRTPLTRLRLRAERVGNGDLRESMLGDLTQMGRMLDETLEYLRDDAKSEAMSRVDLPSLLQTICSDFSDVGHSVSYDGLPRLTWTCRPRALARAVTNVVENGLKHGKSVSVGVGINAAGAVEIDVSDDGPGIPTPLREAIFQPFFKANAARGADGGFGLGLSIANDITKRHGGYIALIDRHPAGLIVRIMLPAEMSVGTA